MTSTDSGVSGFSRNWKAPSRAARTASASWALPLIMMTGADTPALAERLQRGQPVRARRHHQVEEDGVGFRLVHRQERGVAVGRLGHDMPLGAQQRAEHPADVGFVVDEEDGGHRVKIGRAPVRQRRMRAQASLALTRRMLAVAAVRTGDCPASITTKVAPRPACP